MVATMEDSSSSSSSAVDDDNVHDDNVDGTTASLVASMGDIVTVDITLIPEGNFVPEGLFDATGRSLSFVVGWGNYLPGVHELVNGMTVGSSVQNVSIDAGFGRPNNDMIIEVPKDNLKKIKTMDKIVVGATLNLQGRIQVVVVKVTPDTIVVDANHPLAGSSYSCALRLVRVDRFPTNQVEYATPADCTSGERKDDDHPSSSSSSVLNSSPYEIATFAMGCFWGGELAFMRTPGVVGTRVGYTQGVVKDPSYDDVCRGSTRHREAVMVVYDSRVVSYQDLLIVYWERLASTISQYKVDPFAEDHETEQYKNGIYYHTDEQHRLAREGIDSINDRYNVELRVAAIFYDAEDYHQQYLYKGGQSARKGAREPIRCFG
jgi:peptide-methionine (S)-S-oxide reductase